MSHTILQNNQGGEDIQIQKSLSRSKSKDLSLRSISFKVKQERSENLLTTEPVKI